MKKLSIVAIALLMTTAATVPAHAAVSAAGTGLDLVNNFTAPTGLGIPAVPEPGTLGLLAVGAVGLITRRRRNR